MKKLFVGGLPYSMTNQDLSSLFAQFGTVISADVIIDRTTNQSKGFGFVEMSTDEEAQQAINGLNGSDIDGRKLGVSLARPKEEQPRSGGFNRGGFDRNRDSRGGFNRDSRGRGGKRY